MNRRQYRDALYKAEYRLADMLILKGATITTAESITGGMIASSIVDVPGSSNWFKYGFVTYSDEAKHNVLGVSAELLKRESAVSGSVAEEMAIGALKRSGADYAIAVTGLAGPGLDELGRAPGLVYIGAANEKGVRVKKFNFSGNRNEIRRKTNLSALRMAAEMVRKDIKNRQTEGSEDWDDVCSPLEIF